MKKITSLVPKTYIPKPTTFNLQPLLVMFLFFVLLTSCYNQERNCKDFKNGTFTSEIEIDGKKYVTTFQRTDSIQTETFEGTTDSFYVRWTNDCEYIIKNVKPKNRAERKAIQVKIMTTTKKSYTYEYNFVGETNKQKGIAYKLKNEK